MFILGLVHSADYEDEAIERILKDTSVVKHYEKTKDPEGKNLMRKAKPIGALSDDDYMGMNDKTYKINKNHKIIKNGGKVFRGQKKHRGSKVGRQIAPKPLPHKPSTEEPLGCGNPICVIIDRKPIRFSSICRYNQFCAEQNRKNQMNFIQKGCCYDIIDKKDGALTKPWTPNDLDLADCSACQKDESCNMKITVNIDLKNILYGESSAFGGKTYHEQDAHRMVGVPIEFENVCAAMKFFKSKENINIKTQVIGIAIGAKGDLFPRDPISDKCLWTEWFDHDTPCNSDGDKELHSEHQQRLEETETGPLRICMPNEMAGSTQHEGGSEVTRVSAIDAKNGEALGFSSKGSTSKPFSQVIEYGNLNIQCIDTQQTIAKLPPPFIFAEGVEKNNKKNATCLDFKSRYCCKGNQQYRPTAVNYFENFIPPKIPIGSAVTELKIASDGKFIEATIKIFPTQGSSEPASIKITANGKTCSAMIMDGGKTTTVQGTCESKTKPDGTMEIIIDLSKTAKGYFAKILISHKSTGTVTETEIRDNKGTKSVSRITIEEKVTIITTNIVNKKGEKMDIVCDSMGVKKNSTGQLEFQTNDEGVWEKLAVLVQELSIQFFIESPPLAGIFAECEWKDWLNQEYPGKYRTGAEWEIRQEIAKNRKFHKHVCGDVPEKAHYVDAVTVDKQIPWHELKLEAKQYETFKLTPFHGYICNDQNMPSKPEFCQDMKVRYCCVKNLRAQWSVWGEWSDCSRTCGGGTAKRIKTCQQSRNRKKGSGLHATAYNPKCVGEETDSKRKQCSEQIHSCNIESCPVNFLWANWAMWSSCTVSCGSGHKQRTRTCSPAQNGGSTCPDKKKEMDLFAEEMDCTQKDCERFYEGGWSGWSSCSKTCGEGSKIRNRICISELTLQQVADTSCANNKAHFNQNMKCKMQDCPVNGGWSVWTLFSSCDQNCIDHPECTSCSQKTKAKRSRRRYCNKPMAAYGGKKCEKNSKFKWISHDKAEMDSTNCISELKKKSGEKATPWCPENCIMTAWSEWSACSSTCVVSSQGNTVQYHGYIEGGKAKDRMAKNIEMYPPIPPTTLPKRNRFRSIFKKEKFGGQCPEESFWKTRKGMEGMIFQDEDCRLCKEHCPDMNMNSNSVYEWQELKYPGYDAGCVGYCLVNCTWNPPIDTEDCKAAQEEYFNLTKTEKHGNCYISEVIVLLIENEFKVEADAFKLECEELIKKSGVEKSEYAFPEDYKDLKSLAKFVKPSNDLAKSVKSKLSYRWAKDRELIIKYTRTITIKTAIVPVLDGLYGGKACQRSTADTKKLTVRKDKDPKFDIKIHHNGHPEDKIEYYNACEIILCTIEGEITTIDPGRGDGKCEAFSWSAWGEWGQCDLKCGDEGKRKRKRKCLNICENKEYKGKCKPFFNNIHNKKYTETDTTRCSPCPALDTAQWSQWTDWSNQADLCGECGDICGLGQYIKMTRKRTCVAAKDGSKKCLESNKKEEIKELPMPACKADSLNSAAAVPQSNGDPAVTDTNVVDIVPSESTPLTDTTIVEDIGLQSPSGTQKEYSPPSNGVPGDYSDDGDDDASSELSEEYLTDSEEYGIRE